MNGLFPATLLPAYGRDYKSKKEVEDAFNSNKDFLAVTFDRTMYVNKKDLLNHFDSVKIRYSNKRKCCFVEVVL